ncbi:MAG: lytic murein transglycosylase [Patescibacteria group bacterium]
MKNFFKFSLFFLAVMLAAAAVNLTFAQNPLEEERKVLEAELEKYEKEIDEYESTISTLKKQGGNLQSEINKINAKISQLNVKIKATNTSIKKLDDEIKFTQTKINSTETDIDFNQKALADVLQNIYENEKRGTMEIFLANDNLSDFFNNLNGLMEVQDNLKMVLRRIVDLRQDLVDAKESLALEKLDAEELKKYMDAQKSSVQKTQTEKNSLLKVTKGKESEYQKLLVESKKNAAEIRNRIFRMLGGGELPFGEAVKIAQAAEKATGVRAAFMLAVLTQESAVNGVIGSNLGKCYYNTPRNNNSKTVMSDSQKPAFLKIMEELNMNPDTTPVSCPIASDGAYGGAMGPAQFMPTTWKLYKNRVGEITGGNPASPFNNLDAFTATALYLKDGLVSCKQIYNSSFPQENCAAAKYYAGKNYRSYMSVGRYGYRVADRAVKFEDDIEAISS